MASPMRITLSQVILRPYLTSDVSALQRGANNPKIAAYMRNTFPSPYTLADAEKWAAHAAETCHLNLAIALRDSSDDSSSGTLCGSIGLMVLGDVEVRTNQLGYWVREELWGRGIATEAVRAFSEWAFSTKPGLERLEAGVYAGNDASERVLKKAGFVYEGSRRRAVFKNGEFRDLNIFGLLREEIEGAKDG